MDLIRYLLTILLFVILMWAFKRILKHSMLNTLMDFTIVFLVFMFVLELGLNGFYRFTSDNWYFLSTPNPNDALFESHPYLNVSNKKNVDQWFNGVHIKHNKGGWRGDDVDSSTLSNKYKIVALGGSTTYGVGVNNEDTWPEQLQAMAGEDTLVFNLAVPGHSSLENLITAALYLDAIKPDAILLHVGLNDMRQAHTKNLSADYRDFHNAQLFGIMGGCYLNRLPRIATLYYAVRLLQSTGLYPVCAFHKSTYDGESKSELDRKGLAFYGRHLDKLIHTSFYYTKDVRLIPQVLLEEKVAKDALKWWIPYIESKDLVPTLKAYNDVSRQMAEKNHVYYLDTVDVHTWHAEDFVDPSHLNKEGNRLLAKMILASFIKSKEGVEYSTD